MTASGGGLVTSAVILPWWLARAAIAAVWMYEGLWCKLLHGQPHELKVVESVPYFGSRIGGYALAALGGVEIAIAVWVLSGAAPQACAMTQTVLLVLMNCAGLLWARHLIPDPAGMALKNLAFLVLVWVSASPHRGA